LRHDGRKKPVGWNLKRRRIFRVYNIAMIERHCALPPRAAASSFPNPRAAQWIRDESRASAQAPKIVDADDWLLSGGPPLRR
jgi:hypothetical protein